MRRNSLDQGISRTYKSVVSKSYRWSFDLFEKIILNLLLVSRPNGGEYC